MKKEIRGSVTVEAAVIVPVMLFVFGILLHILFYYHDKNVLTAVAHETTVFGSSLDKPEQSVLEDHLEEHVRGKLLLFQTFHHEIKIKEHWIEISCEAWKKPMSLKIACAANRTNPEDYIRTLRKIKKIGEKVEEQGEDIYKE